MKRLLLILIAVLLLSVTNQSFADLNYGLVAYYPFNGNANDESGHGNHGVVYGAVLTEDRLGNADSAYSFDGWDDRIVVQNSPLIGFSHQPFSISVWIKADPVQYFRAGIVSKRIGIEPDVGFHLWQIGTSPEIPELRENTVALGLTHYDESHRLGRSGQAIFSSSKTNDSEWHHIVSTYDNNYMRIYVNGILENIIMHDSGFDNNASPLLIGSFWYSYSDGHGGRKWCTLNGSIDELRIYNRALSDTEVFELFKEGTVGKVYFHLKPGSCPNAFNRGQRGVLPAAILGLEDFDVTVLDPLSVELYGPGETGPVYPIRWSLDDAGTPCMDCEDCECFTYEEPDGILDLALKFDAMEIKYLLDESLVGDTVPLTIRIKTIEEKEFIGSDCLLIVK